jgi:trimeric autotransporter adhesin
MPFARTLPVYLRICICCTLILFVCAPLGAQQAATSSAAAIVPRLVNFSGRAADAQGKPVTGTAGITFSIYNDQYEGAPLWMETQNVTADAKGNYAVQLGASSAEGLPLDLFTSGEARWLGVRVNGGEEQPRILLLSVPYALKAADAETVGGLPASAFMLAGAANAKTAPTGAIAVAAMPSTSASPATTADVTTSGGTVNTLPLFSTATNVQSSILTQTGSGATGKIGFNTTTPATVLDVNGGATVRGTLAVATTGTATAAAGKNSQPLDFTASAYNSSTAAAVAQKFQWQAEPAANDTAAPAATMNLLYASGSGTPAETGLKISNKGLIAFATGQTFPTVTGNETVTGDLTASELISTVATGTAPLKVTSTTEVANLNAGLLGGKAASAFAQLAAANTFSQYNTFNNSVIVNSAITALVASSSGPGYRGVYGIASATSGGSVGVYGTTQDPSGSGVFGENFSTAFSSGTLRGGVVGVDNGASGLASGVSGQAIYGNGVRGVATGSGAWAVWASGFNAPSGSGTNGGLAVEANGGDGDLSGSFSGGYGIAVTGGNAGAGAHGGNAVSAFGGNGGDGGDGISAVGGGGGTGGSDGMGGYFTGGSGSAYGDGIYAAAGTNSTSAWAGDFLGDVNIDGTVYAGAKDFKIDHPLDPANKYLLHTSVESSEMMNIYSGVTTLDANGEAVVQMPEWFGALNRDFRYQLTCIGGFAPVYIAEELAGNQFKIAGGHGGMRVSWEITGVRQDAYAKAHPLQVEQDKPQKQRGFYIHPELYGAPPERQIEWSRHPQQQKGVDENRQQLKMRQKQARPQQSAAVR